VAGLVTKGRTEQYSLQAVDSIDEDIEFDYQDDALICFIFKVFRFNDSILNISEK